MQTGGENGDVVDDLNLQQLQLLLRDSRSSIVELNSKLDDLDRRNAEVIGDLQRLRERLNEKGADAAVQKLVPILESLKELESRESVLESEYNAKRSVFLAEVSELEEKIEAGLDRETILEELDMALAELLKERNAAKKELAAKLRDTLSMKRQLDEVPTQPELIQYERRFSELNAHIQEKHQQTRKYYATYNALLEIKELMLKETSLLNSISSQFQDAITSTDGRMKLINSMEGIVKGSQQKLKKVEVEFLEDQKVCDAVKKQYAAAMAEQRQSYSLLKSLQEECAKNLRLKSLSSA